MTGTLLSSDAAPAPTLPAVCGLPLAVYRPDHLHRSALRTARREGVRDFAALAALLSTDDAARTRFRRAVAASHSGLFRDAEQLRWVDRTLLPGLAASGRPLRMWSAGCASGEEPFTLAMMLEWHGALGRSEIVGSDVLDENLAEGESGVCAGSRMPAPLRMRVRWDCRELVHGGTPGGGFDLILCRNLTSYLTDEAALALHGSLTTALNEGATLVLGRGEELKADPQSLGLERIADSAYRKSPNH